MLGELIVDLFAEEILETAYVVNFCWSELSTEINGVNLGFRRIEMRYLVDAGK